MHGGIDEAGRGPVLGPLVVAGVAADEESMRRLGAKDSKKVAPGRREHLARKLQSSPDVIVELRIMSAAELDEEMAHRSLNEVEVMLFQDIAKALVARGAERVVVDAADVDFKRFGNRIAEKLPQNVEVVSRHQADATDAVVGAASVVAKAERDKAVREIGKLLEPKVGCSMGSGYPSDPYTKRFLQAWVDKFGELPPETRTRWKTARELMAPKQADLSAFDASSES